MARSKKKLNPAAVRAANDAVKSETGGRSLTMDPKDAALRKKWMDAFKKAEKAGQAKKKCGSSIQDCKDHCLKIILVDENDTPYAGTQYTIDHPNEGSQFKTGKLDNNGSAYFQSDVKEGTYYVEFPLFDPCQPKKSASSQPGQQVSVKPCGKEKKVTVKCGQNVSKQTTPHDTTLKVIVPRVRKEFIIIVGTEQFRDDYGNKMNFFASAVRDVKKGISNVGGKNYDFVTILYFGDGYASTLISEVIYSLANHKVNLKQINTRQDIVNYINEPNVLEVTKTTPRTTRKVCRKITRVHVYSHGYPSELRFGYNGSNDKAQTFGKIHVASITKDRFDREAIFYSYACRTGMSDERSLRNKLSFKNDAEAKPKDSLAQMLANHLDIKVYAWIMRTDYKPVWNDGGDKKFRAGYKKLVRKKGRLWNDKCIWHPEGAYNSPGAGSTPKGLSKNVYLFEAGKEPKKK